MGSPLRYRCLSRSPLSPGAIKMPYREGDVVSLWVHFETDDSEEFRNHINEHNRAFYEPLDLWVPPMRDSTPPTVEQLEERSKASEEAEESAKKGKDQYYKNYDAWWDESS